MPHFLILDLKIHSFQWNRRSKKCCWSKHVLSRTPERPLDNLREIQSQGAANKPANGPSQTWEGFFQASSQRSKEASTRMSVGETSTLGHGEKLQNEIEFYCKMEEICAEDSPLSWWKQNAGTFPLLALCAKKYLCISASSCASEWVFSISGTICNPKRVRLTQET